MCPPLYVIVLLTFQGVAWMSPFYGLCGHQAGLGPSQSSLGTALHWHTIIFLYYRIYCYVICAIYIYYYIYFYNFHSVAISYSHVWISQIKPILEATNYGLIIFLPTWCLAHTKYLENAHSWILYLWVLFNPSVSFFPLWYHCCNCLEILWELASELIHKLDDDSFHSIILSKKTFYSFISYLVCEI